MKRRFIAGLGAGATQNISFREAAAPSFGMQVSSAAIRSEADVEDAMSAAAGQSDMGLIVSIGPPINVLRKVIFEQAARHRLPAIYPFRYFVAEGGLMSYGTETINQSINTPTFTQRIEEKASERRSGFSLEFFASCAWTKRPCF